jgi:hypothetical protein
VTHEHGLLITVLEGKVEPDRVADLESAFRAATFELPPEIVDTYLVRNAYEESTFQIITIWQSREALMAVRASGTAPSGVLVFEAAGATTTHIVLDVLDSSRQT